MKKKALHSGLHKYTHEDITRLSPGERMKAIGIRQDDDPILRQVSRPFELPLEKDAAQLVIEQLQHAIEIAQQIHDFAKGLGVAAPQIGIDRALAIVIPLNEEPLILVNPRIVAQSEEMDEQYEGCWSFFDFRGLVSRPLDLEVAYQSVDGKERVTTVNHAMARLVAHEIDHLNSILYKDLMPRGRKLLTYEEYKQKKQSWHYPS